MFWLNSVGNLKQLSTVVYSMVLVPYLPGRGTRVPDPDMDLDLVGSGPFWSDPEPDAEKFQRILIL